VTDLATQLANTDTDTSKVFHELRRLVIIRRQQPAFHPNATQFTLHLGKPVFAFWRQSINRNQSIFCLSNISKSSQTINLSDINLISTDPWYDLISGESYDDIGRKLKLKPYQTVWITNFRPQP